VNVNKEKKAGIVKELRDDLSQNSTVYFLDFVNMSVAQSIELRRIMRENAYKFQVIKNRLAVRALDDDVSDEVKSLFRGPTAFAFASENPLGLAKIIKEFSAKNKVLNFKGGILEGQYLPQERFSEVANIKSREELLAKIGYSLSYQLAKLLQTWQAPMMNLGRLLSQLKSKK
jgi:large subunit ribosomal protein L10